MKPNIVYIVADQWRGDCLGLYGNRHPVMTPHINQLASEGVLFSQAYADCPICMPQRVTELTGYTGSQLRCLSNFNERTAPEFDKQATLPARLAREAGYQTKAVGKMHFAPARSRYGFEHVTLHPDDYLWYLEDKGLGGTFRGHGLGGNEVYPATAVTPEEHYHTSWTIEQAVNFLDRRDPECPFMLYVVFEAPHSPFDPPAPYDRMYDNFTIPEPVRGDWMQGARPPMFDIGPAAGKWDHLTSEVIRETRRRYYGQISQIDYRLGRLFGTLKSRGLDDNTVIVFTADHGENLGDHDQFGKFCFLQSSARVPLVLRLPKGHPGHGKPIERTAPVCTADICPTLMELAGLEPDGRAEGVSLLPRVEDEAAGQDRTIFGETPTSAMAVRGTMKYIYYRQGGHQQLFDTLADPDDLHNLVDRPEHSGECERLRGELTEYLAGNGSDMVEGGKLVRSEAPDPASLRGRNGTACRGPMRGGMGY